MSSAPGMRFRPNQPPALPFHDPRPLCPTTNFLQSQETFNHSIEQCYLIRTSQLPRPEPLHTSHYLPPHHSHHVSQQNTRPAVLRPPERDNTTEHAAPQLPGTDTDDGHTARLRERSARRGGEVQRAAMVRRPFLSNLCSYGACITFQLGC